MMRISASCIRLPFQFALCFTLFSLAAPIGLAQVVVIGSGPQGTFHPNVHQSPASGSYAISGTVVDAVSGEAIRRALVNLSGGAQQIAVLSDASGRFSFENLPNGMYRLAATRPGYFNKRNAELAVTIGDQSPGSVKLSLVPGSSIEGQIKNAQGEPLEGIRISAFRSRVQNGRRIWSEVGSANSDEDGHYRIFRLEPGTYILQTSSRPEHPMLPMKDTEQRGYRGVYFPLAPDRASAARLRIDPGQDMRADFELSLEPMYRVSGTVPANEMGVSVQVRDAEGNNLGGVGYRQNGEFEIQDLPAGSYEIRVDAMPREAPGQSRLTATMPITVGPSRSGLLFALHPLTSIPVESCIDGSQQPNNLMSMSAINGIRLESQSGGQAISPTVSAPNDKPEPALHDVPPGTYDVDFNWPSPCEVSGKEVKRATYLHSLRAGSVDLMHAPLVVPEGGLSDPIDVVLRDDGAAMSVSLEKAEPNSAISLIIVPESSNALPSVRTLYVMPRTESSVCGLAPGEYSVTAIKTNGEEIEYKNPEVLRSLLSSAVHVSLAPRRVTNVRLNSVESLGDGQ